MGAHGQEEEPWPGQLALFYDMYIRPLFFLLNAQDLFTANKLNISYFPWYRPVFPP
jgi:hypothetical protein